MTVDSSLRQLWSRLHELRDAVLELRVTVVEDRPSGDATLLADRLSDEAEELVAALEEALHAIAGSVDSADDLQRVQRAVDAANRCILASARRFFSGPGDPRHVRELRRVAHRGPSGWSEWARAVETAAERCPEPLFAAAESVQTAWDELAARLQAGTVQVTANAVGNVSFHDEHARAIG